MDLIKLKIISGGQTGADLAGLWIAKVFDIKSGGMAPKNFKTLIGNKPELKDFNLIESIGGYRQRTIENIKQSDLTLIYAGKLESPGTKLTIDQCKKYNKPTLILDCNLNIDDLLNNKNHRFIKSELFKLFSANKQLTINVAGNSSKSFNSTFLITFISLYDIISEYFNSFPLKNLIGDSILLKDEYDINVLENIKKIHQINLLSY